MTELGSTERHLVLVGLMGAGKTTVGECCAERLGRPFVDTDDIVAASTGHSVGEIFAVEGDRAFRAAERRAVDDACASPEPLVIASGGGAVLDAENRRVLRTHGYVVWLDAPPDVLAERVQAEVRDRPLLATYGAPATLERLAVTRAASYEAAAHARVDTDGRSVDEVTDAVLEEFERCAA